MAGKDPTVIVKRAALLALAAIVLIGLAVGWAGFRRARQGYDAYRSKIQQGIRVAGVDVGWLTPEEAQTEVSRRIAEPYYRDFVLHYGDNGLDLSPQEDLGLEIPVREMVEEAVAASHRYDYWPGLWRWAQGEADKKPLDIPFELSFDETAAARFLAEVAQQHDVAVVQPRVDTPALAFVPGRPGTRLEVEAGAALINERVPDPARREVTLPTSALEPDHSAGHVEALLRPLAPLLELPPTAPSYYTATLPLSSTAGLAACLPSAVQGTPGAGIGDTPPVTYTGELTWTCPHFAGYSGPLTSTYGFFFDPGQPGSTLDLERAVGRVEVALRAGVTTPITIAAESIAPPAVTPDLLLPPLQALLDEFPGVASLLVKDLDSGEVLYDEGNDYILAGMSVVKIGIMVEVYRANKGEIDEETRQELTAMLGSESCNPCANRLLTAIGNGSATAGAQKVTQTMRKLGLANFRLCSPFRVVQRWGDEGQMRLTASLDVTTPVLGTGGGAASGRWVSAAPADAKPRYDNCVHATPREMAELVEMIYQCAQDAGSLRKTYPDIFRPPLCQGMIDIMAANNLRNMLGAGIPAEVKLAHKHGFAGYDVPWGDTRAEVGIVFSPGADYLVSFYIWEDTPWIDFGVAQPLYRDVSNLLYNYFNPEEPYWAPPPWAPSPQLAIAQ